MAETSYPFDGEDTTESEFSAFFRKLQATGVWAHPDDFALQVVPDTGLDVTVNAGFAAVRGIAYNNDADLTVSIGAGDVQPRIDLIVLQLDPTANSTTVQVVAGTPATSPTAPDPTQTDTGNYEMVLARVTVPASAATISSGNITDARPYMGFVAGLWKNARRPANPRLGQLGYNIDLGYSEEWNGTAWQPAGIPAELDADTVNGHAVYTGTSAPSSSFGNVGDIYFQHEA